MAQAITPSPVEDIRDVAEVLAQLRDFVDPDEFTALDYLSGKLTNAAAEIEAREAA